MMLAVGGLRELGVTATAMSPRHPLVYGTPDIVPPSNRLRRLGVTLRAIQRHDVFHFYFGESLAPRQLDASWYTRMGKRVVMEFMGSDARVPSVDARRNPHYVRIEPEDDARAISSMRRWSAATQGHVIMGDPGMRAYLEPYFEHIHPVGKRVNVAGLPPMPPPADGKLMKVVHAPTHLAGKGTMFVRAATEALNRAGAPIDYVEVHGVSHEQALEIVASADLVVDQLCSGSYGVLAAEAMSMAKPVVCYLLPEVEALYPTGLPIINANPTNVKDVLVEWMEQPHERHRRGLASRAYAERVHDHRAAAARLLEIYEMLP
jgi:glycosyltransferase involved in cell wall biosynthesis